MSNEKLGRSASGIHPKSATTTGVYLSEEAKERAFEKMQRADEADMNRQIAGMSILRASGAFLGVIFLIVNSYQATWALMALAGKAGAAEAGAAGAWGWNLAGLTWDQWAVGLTAFGLILAAQVVAVRLVIADSSMKALGVLLLIGLMAFSVLTSAIHMAFNVQGGVEQSVRAGDEYQLAKQRYETAMRAAETARTSYSDYQASVAGGDPWALNATHSKGPARPYVEAIDAAQAEAQAAGRAFEQVKASGGGSAMAEVLGVVAGWFGMETASFALAFALFAVVLMEAVRVYISLLTGRHLAAAMADVARKRSSAAQTPQERRSPISPTFGSKIDETAPEGRSEPPVRPLRSMAANSHSADVVRSEPLTKPQDRKHGTKRQASYAKKLAKLKAALIGGQVGEGESLSFASVRAIVGGGNRETVTALRNEIAQTGMAHWRGSRLVVGRGVVA